MKRTIIYSMVAASTRNWFLRWLFIGPLLLQLLHVPGWVFYSALSLSLGFLIVLYVQSLSILPKLQKSDLLYSENAASGFSHRDILTRLGGAGNCLRVRITSDSLILSSWFPFSLIAPVFDGIHVIPVQKIVSVNPVKSFGRKGLRITFITPGNESLDYTIYPKKFDLLKSTLEKVFPEPRH